MLVLYIFVIKEIYLVLEINLIAIQVLDIKIYFYIDYVSNLFLIIVRLITLRTFLYRKRYIREEKNKIYFLILTSLFVLSIFLIVLSLNLWIILLGWDGLGVVSYLLVIFYQSENSNYSGMITIITNRIGDVGIILAIFFLFNFSSFEIIFNNFYGCSINLFFILIIIGVFTKSAQFPFCSWLPLAIAAPTPISALVHSSTLVTAGVYLLIRFNLLVKNENFLVIILLLLAIFTIFIAGLVALSEVDFKKIIALSTLSQLGVIMIIVLVGNEIIGFYHIITHALFKALLFLCSGIIIHEYRDNQDIRNYNIRFKTNPLVVGIFLVCRFSLIGVPFLRGFYSKDLILEMFYIINYNFILLSIVIISTIITTLYSFRLILFGLFRGKKGFKYVFNKNWDLIYFSLLFCFLGVLILGRVLSWIFLGKIECIILVSIVKLFNVYLVVFGLLLFKKINIIKKRKFINYYIGILYLTTFQGMIINIIIEKISFICFQSERMIEVLFVNKIRKLLNSLNYYMFYLKYIKFYIIFIWILSIIYYWYFYSLYKT